MADEHTLHAQVLTPEGEVFEGDLRQLSTRTQIGELGVLANHVPVLARLVPHELRLHRSEQEIERYAAAEGWLQVYANRALVLVGEAIPPDQLSVDELRERLSDAEGRLSEADEGSAAYEAADRDRTRAEAFLKIAESA